MTGRDYLQRLPTELIFPILTYLPDLESLDSLVRASPVVFRLFEAHGAEIFETVLSSGAIHEHACGLIRIAALVRSLSIPSQAYDLLTFCNFVRHESTSHRYQPPAWTLSPLRITWKTPATTLRSLLATYRRITCLVISCSKFYLDRFKPLRPSHLADESFCFEGAYCGPDRRYVGSWQQRPAERPFPVRDIGPPTWVEEQHLLRTFWRVQLFHELKAAAKASLLSWPDADLERLDRMDVLDFYDVPPVVGWRADDHPEDGPRQNLVHDTTAEPGVNCPTLENQLLWSVIEYTMENKQAIAAPDFLRTSRDWPDPVRGEKDCDTLRDHLSMTYWFYYQVREGEGRHMVEDDCSPLQHVSFKPFRNLGFAIWSKERMFSYGLLRGTSYDEDRFPLDSVFLAWRSVLGKDDIAQVERTNQKAHTLFSKPETDDGDLDDTASERSWRSCPSLFVGRTMSR